MRAEDPQRAAVAAFVTRLLPDVTEGEKKKGRGSGFPLERPALQMEREKGFEVCLTVNAN